jgi:hypothetical protein
LSIGIFSYICNELKLNKMDLYLKLGTSSDGVEVSAMTIIGAGVIVRNSSRKGTDSVFVPSVKLISIEQEDGSVSNEIVPMFVEVKSVQK